MKRNWEGERNFWLDHFRQYHPGVRRNHGRTGITPADCVGIPVPPDLAVPLSPPCLAWRWKLRGGGYGVLNGGGAHAAVFEQTRGRTVREERQINHLCNRLFCIQPAHLYEGTAKQNSEDRQAGVAGGRYPHWKAMAHRFDRVLTRHHWAAPGPEAVSAGWGKPLECPHGEMPEMFGKRERAEGTGLCANCGAERLVLEDRVSVRRRPCGMAQPCRCEEREGEELIHSCPSRRVTGWRAEAGAIFSNLNGRHPATDVPGQKKVKRKSGRGKIPRLTSYGLDATPKEEWAPAYPGTR